MGAAGLLPDIGIGMSYKAAEPRVDHVDGLGQHADEVAALGNQAFTVS